MLATVTGRRPAVRRDSQEGVAQDAHQVVELVVAVQHPLAGEHSREGLLHEVLGILARAAQSPGGAIEAVDVLAQRLWIEDAHGLSGSDVSG